MSAEILLIISLTAIIQSIFGVGILLFGAPILLLLGYDFVTILTILLPISLVVSVLQIIPHARHIDQTVLRKIAVYTLPLIAIFLFFVTQAALNINLIVGVFLLLIAFKNFSVRIGQGLNALMRYETVYFVLIGVVHGLSSLGGSLFTAYVQHKHYAKEQARATIAACEGTFVVVQLLTLFFLNTAPAYLSLNESLIYWVCGVMVFVLVDELIYKQINQEKYQNLFSVFLGVTGVALLLKAFI
jgi:hypothetical protein